MLTEHLRAGRAVVLDHAPWRRSDRDERKKTVRTAGGRPAVRLPPGVLEELLQRLAARNQRQDADALTVTPEALDDLIAPFERPADDEDAVTYAEAIRSMVR